MNKWIIGLVFLGFGIYMLLPIVFNAPKVDFSFPPLWLIIIFIVIYVLYRKFK